MVGIWWESFPVQVKFGWALTKKIFPPNSYQAPGFHPDSSDSARKRWGTVKYSVMERRKKNHKKEVLHSEAVSRKQTQG